MSKEHSIIRHIGNYNGDYYHCMDCDCALIINVILILSRERKECECKNE